MIALSMSAVSSVSSVLTEKSRQTRRQNVHNSNGMTRCATLSAIMQVWLASKKKKKKRKQNKILTAYRWNFPIASIVRHHFLECTMCVPPGKKEIEKKSRSNRRSKWPIARSKSAIPMNEASRTRYYFDPLTVLYGSFFLFFFYPRVEKTALRELVRGNIA